MDTTRADHDRATRRDRLITTLLRPSAPPIGWGVAVAGIVLELGLLVRGDSVVAVADFTAAFLVVGVITMAAAIPFLALSPTAGAEAAGRMKPKD